MTTTKLTNEVLKYDNPKADKSDNPKVDNPKVPSTHKNCSGRLFFEVTLSSNQGKE
jgi:hypothetical protein